MLEALEKGVKGGVWFSLIDKVHRPQVLLKAWSQVKGKGRAVGSDHQSLKQFEEQLEINLDKLEEEPSTSTNPAARPSGRWGYPRCGTKWCKPR